MIQKTMEVGYKVQYCIYIYVRETRELNSRRLENLQRKLQEQKCIYEEHSANNNSS